MTRKTVALSIDEDVYDKYQEYCKSNFQVLSRIVEDFMKKELEKNGKDK